MEAVLGIIAIIIGWIIAVPVVCVGGMLLVSTIGRPRAPKPPRPPRPAKAPPLPPSSPRYIRRWGHFKTNTVAADKADWDKDFERLLHL